MRFATLTTVAAVIAIILAAMFAWQGLSLVEQSASAAQASQALDMKVAAIVKLLTGIFILVLGAFVVLIGRLLGRTEQL